MADQIDKISSTSQVLKTKKVERQSNSSQFEKIEAKDQISLSPEAQAALEKKRFIDCLIDMPDIRPQVLEKEYDYSSPKIFKEVAKKILDSGF